MTSANLRDLALQAVTDPRAAARTIMGLGLRDSVVWQIVVLTSVLTAAITAVSFLIQPPQMTLPAFFANPLLMAGFVMLTMTGVARVSTWMAPGFGGGGEWRVLLLLLASVQALRVLAQAVLLVLSLVPAGALFGAFLGLAASIAGVWISAMFTTEALRLSSGWKGLVVLALAGSAVVLGLSIIWAVIGPVPEALPNV